MADIDTLLERNAHFATTTEWKEASFIARNAVYVVSCLDPRVDPSEFLELRLGDATMVRNVGGRISKPVLDDLAYIGYLQKSVVPGGPTFEVVIVHHNQCGSPFLADPEFRNGFAALMGIDDQTVLREKAVVHPELTVRIDVEKVLADPYLPRTITVSGHTYDVTTGLLTTVVPATTMPAHSLSH
jgi:carbonic anhydrase